MSYYDVCIAYNFNRDRLKKIEPLYFENKYGILSQLFTQMEPNTFFICETGGLPTVNSTFWVTVIRTKDILLAYHMDVILKFDNSQTIIEDGVLTDSNWRKVFDLIGYENLNINHYKYLELVIDSFWKQVFGKTTSEMWCSGIITAHGDKGYSHRGDWEKNHIPFNRGMLLYLLTYTREFGNTPKYKSIEWTFSKYKKYLPYILIAEKEAGITSEKVADNVA